MLCTIEQIMLQTVTSDKIADKYTLDEESTIGEGGYAKVVKARENKTGKIVAVKIIKKQKMNEDEEILLEREIYIMKNISHPNIVEFYDYYSDKKNIYLVLQYLSGGELYEEIIEKEVYTENEARKIISPIVDAVRYLHQCGIVHRDLKPENVVFSSRKSDRVLKLIDFGVSQMISNEAHLMSTNVGTPLYMAPQMLSGTKYDEQVDWWAIGVIMYVLLCGYPPFESENEFDLRNEIKNGGVKYQGEEWKEISESALDLLTKLMEIQPEKRIGSEEIINHQWMLQEGKGKDLKNVQDNLKKFVSKLKQIKNAIRAVNIMKGLKKS